MELNVTLHDSQGNEIEIPNCKCGKKSDTFFSGTQSILWLCNECLYGTTVPMKFAYRPTADTSFISEWGGSLNAIIDGEVKNIAQHLNEMEATKEEMKDYE